MNNWLSPLQWLVFLALWRMSYETANIHRAASDEKSYRVEKPSGETTVSPREKEWTEKAVRKYADAQGKKWQHWKEAMFERLD